MSEIFGNTITPYDAKSIIDKKNATKEIIQEMVLCGLSRAGFFEKAAFYGGTALRIFYGLDRFSEDLDFSLKCPDANFELNKYFYTLEKEIRSFGLNMTIEQKKKSKESQIQSAFLKGDTFEHLMFFFPDEHIQAAANEKIKIKFEIDTDPAAYAEFEQRYRLLPAPYQVCLYDQASLFAGKIHAVLCRGWKNRVKGRDLYDYVFYLSRKTKVNLKHLSAKLVQTGYLEATQKLTMTQLKESLYNRFASIDYELAKEDVQPFLIDKNATALWSTEFFCDITRSFLA